MIIEYKNGDSIAELKLDAAEYDIMLLLHSFLGEKEINNANSVCEGLDRMLNADRLPRDFDRDKAFVMLAMLRVLRATTIEFDLM